MKEAPSNQDIVARLDEIAVHLKNLDRRDRMRMVGSTVRGVVNLVILGLVLWSSWFLYENMGEILKLAAQEAAKQAATATKSGSEDFLQQLQKMMGR